MQYSVPQFIEEEGKIIFFLTFRQFFLLCGGGFACIIFYFLLPFWLFAVLSVIVILSAASTAFVKIEGESIVQIFIHFLGFSMADKNYIWKNGDLTKPMSAGGVSRVREVKKMIETKK